MTDIDQLEPRKIPTQRRSKEMVAALIEATARVLKEDGYAAATTNRIAEVAGVSVGSLYQYFPNRESLIYALAGQHAEEMLGLLSGVIAVADAPIPIAIRAFVRAMIEAHTGDPEVHRALLEQALSVGLEYFLHFQNQAVDRVALWMTLRRAELDVADVRMAAWMVVVTAQSTIHAALLEEPGRLAEAGFEDELVRMLSRYVVKE
jgi:AcrR family transcriptional regulator